MRVYINDNVVMVNNHYENRLFIYDRITGTEFNINEESYAYIKNIKNHAYNETQVKELFDKDFINQLFELEILTLKKQKNINNVKEIAQYNNARLFVELTNKCNLKCKHCYGNFGCQSNDMLDLKQLTKVIHDASINGAYQLDLTGGEPFLYPYLEELLSVAYDEGMLVRIFTNLTLLTNEKIHLLKKYGIKEIITSLDSDNPIIHDDFRGQKDCFNKTVQSIHKLKENGISITVNTMIGNHNKDNINSLIKFIQNLHVKSVLDVIVPEGRGIELNENIKESSLIIKKIYDDYYKIIDKNAISIHCGIGSRFIYIKSDGNIYLCPSLIEEKYKLGNINHYSTKQIWKYMSEKFSYLTCNSKCQKCQKCKGGCRARALRMHNDICGQDDVYCIINGIGVLDD